MRAERANAIMVLPDSMLLDRRARIADLAIQGHLPMVSAMRNHAEAGGLLAYGPSVSETFRRAATYVDKILKGTKRSFAKSHFHSVEEARALTTDQGTPGDSR
jgi:putative tryptophan/tyrosine transport system substrate-binding protein